MMLEEAAGITKYKKKEAESRRKLDLTKRNLNRVEDILVEVQSQMRSLKRQASKARRYKALGAEIQRLEILIHSNVYDELREESGTRIKSSEALLDSVPSTNRIFRRTSPCLDRTILSRLLLVCVP